MKNLSLLLKFMKGNILVYIGALLAIMLSSVATIAIPLIIRITIDSIIGDASMNLPAFLEAPIKSFGGKSILEKSLWAVSALLVLITLIQGVFMYFKGKLAAVASENSGKNIRERIYNHLMHLPYDYHVKAKAGDLIQRCTSDVETIQNFVSGQLIEVGQSIVSLTYILTVMFLINTKYTFISIALVPLILISTIVVFVKMGVAFGKADKAEGMMSATLQENLTGTRVVRAFGAHSLEMEKFDEKSTEYRNSIKTIIRLMANFWSVSDFLCLFQYSAVLMSGVYWTARGEITLGTLVAFTTFAGMLIWPIRSLGQMMAFMGQSFVSLNRIQEILQNEVEQDDVDENNRYVAKETEIAETTKTKETTKTTKTTKTTETTKEVDIKGKIQFDNVYFEYERDKPILNGVSFIAERGKTVALLGATGSGKSSLVHLLLRLYDYQSGSIKLDGVELNTISRKWLRKNIGIVLQEPFLFAKTIKENIKLAVPDATDDDMVEAARISEVDDNIRNFDSAYDTVIGERGTTVSGGQKQRIAIARTVIRDVPVLIFDDSLSAVDMETDEAIRKSLKKRSKNTTTIIISHRITTLAEADIILVLEEGRVAQSGTHEELIKEEGLYKRIWLIQNSLEEELVG